MSAMSTLPDRAEVLARLNAIIDPKSGKGLSDAGLVQGLVLKDDRAGFMIEIAGQDAGLYQPVREAAEALLKSLPGVAKAHVALTAEADDARPPEPPPAPYSVRVRRGARVNPEVDAPPPPSSSSSLSAGRMGPAIDRHQALRIHRRVLLRGGEARVAEQFLDRPKIRPGAEKMRRKGVA